MFGKRKSDGNPDSVPVIKYVSMIILDAVENERNEIVIRSSDTFPTLQEMRGDQHPEKFPHATLSPPSFSAIANRLKVMAKVTPMKHKTPVSGNIIFNAHGESYSMSALFDDTVADPCCTLQITKDGVPNNHKEGTGE